MGVHIIRVGGTTLILLGLEIKIRHRTRINIDLKVICKVTNNRISELIKTTNTET